MIRSLATATILALAAQSAAAAAALEGIWARTAKECRDKEGPNSRTSIDLAGRENGKAAPLFDQYEHHCRIETVGRSGAGAKLSLRCYEFWDDYRANRNQRRETVTLATLGRNRLRMGGKTYVRCPD